MSMSPKDLDFIEAKHGAAREIALALGVPPMLLGIPGDNTFSNYQEANRTFWRQTVPPLVQRTTASLAEWLAPAYGLTLTLKANLDDIDALSSERDAQWARLEKTTFLTTNEKRAAIGYGPLQSGGTNAPVAPRPIPKDFNPDQPRDIDGRWTTDDGAGDPGIEGGGGDQGDTETDHPPPPKIGDDSEKPQDAADKTPQYKTPKAGVSGAEGAKDIPSWAKGQRPLVTEDRKAFARRLMDGKYGGGNWSEASPEYSKIKKYGDRSF